MVARMKLALGTAQFGLHYGIANTNGQVTEKMAKKILCRAKAAGINTLDTAIAYGDSERCLGEVGVVDWRVITKLPAIPDECRDVAGWVNEQFNDSLNRIRVDNIAVLMLHRPMQLLESSGQKLWSTMQVLKFKGLVEKIGFSIYDPIELDQLWNQFRPDIIQAPYNILDTRLKTSGWLGRLRDNSIEVHTRSVFLQGLLLMDSDQRPAKFNKWRVLWDQWDQWLVEHQFTPIEACLSFVLLESAIDFSIIGVDTVIQLENILEYAEKDFRLVEPPAFSTDDVGLINPANW